MKNKRQQGEVNQHVLDGTFFDLQMQADSEQLVFLVLNKYPYLVKKEVLTKYNDVLDKASTECIEQAQYTALDWDWTVQRMAEALTEANGLFAKAVHDKECFICDDPVHSGTLDDWTQASVFSYSTSNRTQPMNDMDYVMIFPQDIHSYHLCTMIH